jgi:hypothetical protein
MREKAYDTHKQGAGCGSGVTCTYGYRGRTGRSGCFEPRRHSDMGKRGTILLDYSAVCL